MRKAQAQEMMKHSIVKKRGAGIKNVKAKQCDRQSIESTESMKKLAEEALRVGEMLGIKVISHRAKAIKGITDSIKAKSKIGATKAE